MSGWGKLLKLGFGRRSKAPVCNVVALEGVIASGTGPAVRRGISLARVEGWLEKAFKTWKPAAVAITINSPGGSPAQSDLVHSCIRRLAKETRVPVFTFAHDVAASGGYWLLCAGDKAVACPTSIVGSIGVITGSFGATELLQRVGLERRVYTAGKDKSMLDPFRPETEEGKAKLHSMLQDLHVSFQDLVRASRGSRLKGDPEELFSGQAFTGRQGKELGLVDDLGNMHSYMQQQLGPQTVFRLCSERPRAPLFGLSSPLGGLLAGDTQDLVRDACSGMLDELQERMLLARLGL